MVVLYNSNDTHNPNAYITLGINWAAQEVFSKENVVLADTHTLAKIAAQGRHSTLIVLDGQRLDRALIRRIKPAFSTLILWTFEDPFMQDFNLENAGLFDFIFSNDPESALAYGNKGHYLPLAASTKLHTRAIKNASELDYDIFFAGTMWPNRTRTLTEIIDAFPDARLKLICPVNPYLPPLTDKISSLALQRPISHEAFVDFANSSAVTLTLFRDYASHGDVGQATAPGPRFFELALAGTAQVVESVPKMNREYLDVLEGVQLADNTSDLIEEIRKILENNAHRKRLAKKSQKSAEKLHLYEHRLQQIAEISRANFKVKSENEVVPLVRRRRLRVLLCTHSTIYEADWGGVEVYQQTICGLLGREVEFFYWLRRNGACRLVDASGVDVDRFDLADATPWDDVLCDAAEERLFSGVISQFNIDVVHFQHLGHHALSLPMIAKASGAGVVFSMHDYWLISARYNLLNPEIRHNEEEFKSVLSMDMMHHRAEKIPPGAEQTRRAFISRMIHDVDAFLFGTEISKRLLLDVYPMAGEKILEVNGIPAPEGTLLPPRKVFEPLNGRPLKVVILGNFLRSKGADAVLSLLEMANPRHFEFHILGFVHPEYEGVLREIKKENLHIWGRYDVGDMQALKEADVMLALSIWPETYCISLSEAWQYGLIPFVSDIGALADRVEEGVTGFKIPVARPDVLVQKLEYLRSNDVLRKKILEGLSSKLWVDSTQYATGLLALYQQVAPRTEMGAAEMALDMGRLHYLPHPSWRRQAPPRHIFDPPVTRDIGLDLPITVTDWQGIQGSECYLDDICHQLTDSESLEEFKPAESFHIRGWFFTPSVGSAGRLFVVLLPENQIDFPIFMETAREVRGDISKIFAEAPRRSGFSGEWALRGKWCEGTHRIAVVNVVNGRASYQLFPFKIKVKEGKVAAASYQRCSNEEVSRSFERISQCNGISRSIRLPHLPGEEHYLRSGLSPMYFIDDFSVVTPEETDEKAQESGQLFLRGWVCFNGLDRAGDFFATLVNEETEEVAFIALNRTPRGDVRVIHTEAPLCCGFEGYIKGWRGCEGSQKALNGKYRLVLLTLVGEGYAFVPTELTVDFAEGRASQTEKSAGDAGKIGELILKAVDKKQETLPAAFLDQSGDLDSSAE
ncbi:glycosyltransferase [Acetobacteraceae bacterium]|nr:glycosyltransferase [Acetobacteraceae bacterium]